jgi:exopolysaccharide production protein ExoY
MKHAARLASPHFRPAWTQDFSPTGGFAKRGFDVLAALLGLVILSPLFLMLALLITLSDRGPPFYRHRRVGYRGTPFGCLKFRTMAVNADAVLAEHFRRNPESWEEWKAARKLRSDPRITTVGAVLRKLSLDELPQLVNVLRGEMSLVGPRPIVDEELERYGSYAAHYLSTRPGLTGLWQISGRSDVSYDLRVAFDRRYVENWSFVGDVRIIVMTVPAVCLSRGSY